MKTIDVKDARAILDAMKQAQEAKGGEKDKKKTTMPTKEEIEVAVASVVLEEQKTWPEWIVEIIGGWTPSKASFSKGVPYVIGAYMHHALERLREETHKKVRETELESVREMGSVSIELKEREEMFKQSTADTISDLEKERNSKLKQLDNLRAEIHEEYNELFKALREVDPPDDILELREKRKFIEKEYDAAVDELELEYKELKEQIIAIDEAKENWNSKGRKKKRKAEKEEAGEQAKQQV